MADEPRVYGNRWRVVNALGKGGQGVVYEVEHAPAVDVSAAVKIVQNGLATINASGPSDEERFRTTLQVINALRPLVAQNTNPKGALNNYFQSTMP